MRRAGGGGAAPPRRAAGGGLGLAHQRLRACLRLLDQLLGLGLRLVDRVVGRALSEQQRALQHLRVVATDLRRRLGGGRPGAGGGQLLGELLDGDGRSLEQLVDLVTVIAAPRFLDLAAAELLGSDVHAPSW